jgi:hypothetical protein
MRWPCLQACGDDGETLAWAQLSLADKDRPCGRLDWLVDHGLDCRRDQSAWERCPAGRRCRDVSPEILVAGKERPIVRGSLWDAARRPVIRREIHFRVKGIRAADCGFGTCRPTRNPRTAENADHALLASIWTNPRMIAVARVAIAKTIRRSRRLSSAALEPLSPLVIGSPPGARLITTLRTKLQLGRTVPRRTDLDSQHAPVPVPVPATVTTRAFGTSTQLPDRESRPTTPHASRHATDRTVAPLAGLLTLGSDPARFQTEPPACYRASR